MCELLHVGVEGECCNGPEQCSQPCLCESTWQNQAVHHLETWAESAHTQPAKAKLVLWAGTTDKTADDLLPRYTSLQMPPAAVLNEIEALSTTVKGGIGPLPVNDDNLKKMADKYLPWKYHMLMEYEAANAADAAGRKQYNAN